jgi:hypothetical protein
MFQVCFVKGSSFSRAATTAKSTWPSQAAEKQIFGYVLCQGPTSPAAEKLNEGGCREGYGL